MENTRQRGRRWEQAAESMLRGRGLRPVTRNYTCRCGEIDLIMPLEGDALFDGHPAGWLVCPPGSAHRPTVSQGRALVLYLLPQGRIEFTRT